MAANNIRKFKRNDASYGEGNVKGHPDWAKNNKNRSKLASNNIIDVRSHGYKFDPPLKDYYKLPASIRNDVDFQLRLKKAKKKTTKKTRTA